MDDRVTFCSGCFATNENGSWGPNHVSIEEAETGNGYCINCGGHGVVLVVPRCAAESIRKQASWVGKRYYPHEEDKWNEASMRIGRNRTLWIRFRVDGWMSTVRKLGLFTWHKK